MSFQAKTIEQIIALFPGTYASLDQHCHYFEQSLVVSMVTGL